MSLRDVIDISADEELTRDQRIRHAALALAIQSHDNYAPTDAVLATARKFEAYIAGPSA